MNEKNTFVAWLGFKGTPDFLKSRTIGGFVGVVLSIVLGLLVLLAIMSLAGLLKSVFAFLSEDNKIADPSAAIRNIGLMFAAIIGTPFIVWRSFVAQKQADVAEQGLITDRINKAVEGLGAEKTVKRHRTSQDGKLLYKDKKPELGNDSKREPNFKKPIYEEITVPNIAVRVGAIYSLERIAQDSPRDHIQIMEILCAYIRENVPARTLDPSEKLETRPKLREDIQTAIRVIGRRQKSQKDIESKSHFRLDLRDVDLSGADFSNTDFSAAIFYRSRFVAAIFYDATLHGVNFSHCLLNYAVFRKADLTGSILDHVTISVDGGVYHPTFTSANSFGISISAAKLTGVHYIPPKIFLNIYGDKDTRFAAGKLKNELPEALELIDRYNREVLVGTQEEADSIWRTINEKNIAHFSEWSPFSSIDLANGEIRTAFAKKRNLIGWPYWY